MPHVCGEHCPFSGLPTPVLLDPQPRHEDIFWTSTASGIDMVSGLTVRYTDRGYGSDVTTSDAEAALLWQLKGLQVRDPEPEYRFAKPRRWRFDFAWPDAWLAVEVEGGSWTNGRHTRGAGFEADIEKYNEAALKGWTVIRVTPRMVDDGRAINLVVRGLTK